MITRYCVILTKVPHDTHAEAVSILVSASGGWSHRLLYTENVSLPSSQRYYKRNLKMCFIV